MTTFLWWFSNRGLGTNWDPWMGCNGSIAERRNRIVELLSNFFHSLITVDYLNVFFKTSEHQNDTERILKDIIISKLSGDMKKVWKQLPPKVRLLAIVPHQQMFCSVVTELERFKRIVILRCFFGGASRKCPRFPNNWATSAQNKQLTLMKWLLQAPQEVLGIITFPKPPPPFKNRSGESWGNRKNPDFQNWIDLV